MGNVFYACELGKKLMLPSWLESKREKLEDKLPKVEARILEEA